MRAARDGFKLLTRREAHQRACDRLVATAAYRRVARDCGDGLRSPDPGPDWKSPTLQEVFDALEAIGVVQFVDDDIPKHSGSLVHGVKVVSTGFCETGICATITEADIVKAARDLGLLVSRPL